MELEQSNSNFPTEDKVKDLTRHELKDQAKNVDLDVSDLRKEKKDGLDRLGTSTKQFNEIAEKIYQSWEDKRENAKLSPEDKQRIYNAYIGTNEYKYYRNKIIDQVVGQDIDVKKMSALKTILDNTKHSLNNLEEGISDVQENENSTISYPNDIDKGEVETDQEGSREEKKDAFESNKRVYDEKLLSQDLEESPVNQNEREETHISKRDFLGVSAFLNGIDKVRGPQRGMLKLLYRTMNRINNHKVNGPDAFSISALMKYFSKNIGKVNYTEQEVKENIGAGVDKKDIKRINLLAKYYNEAHQQNKYPIFRRTTALLEQSTSMEEFVGKFDNSMKDYFENNKNYSENRSERLLKKEAPDFLAFTQKLGISADLAYKMSQKEILLETDSYTLDNIVDFNRDGFVNYGDAANKTAIQIKEYAKYYGEQKTVNKFQALGQKQAISIGEKWNSLDEKQKIICMQQAIKNTSSLQSIFENTKETVLMTQKVRDSINENVNNLVAKNPDLKQAIDDGTVTLEGLQQTTSTALINSYQKGLSAGINIPFDQYVKNVSLSIGVSAGKLMEGKPEDFLSIALSYNKNIDLGKGRGAGIGASAGTTLAVIPYASLGGELSKQIANNKSAFEKKYKRIAVGGNVTVMPGLVVLGGKAGIDANRAENVARQAEAIKKDVGDFASALFGSLKNAQDTQLAAVKEFLEKQYADKKVMKEDTLIEAAGLLNSILLTLPKNATSQERQAMLAEALSDARYNQGVATLSNNGWYLSGGSVGLQIANAIPILSAAFRFRRTKLNGYNDTADSIKKVEAQKKGIGNVEVRDFEKKTKIDQSIVDRVNKVFGLSGDDENLITVNGNAVTINKDLWTTKGVTLAIDTSMKQNMKVDTSGNISFHTETPIRPLRSFYGDSVEKQLNIGAFGDGENMIKLSATNTDLPDGFKSETLSSSLIITEKTLKAALKQGTGLRDFDLDISHFADANGEISFALGRTNYTLSKGEKFVITKKHSDLNNPSRITMSYKVESSNSNALPYIEVKTGGEKISGIDVPLKVSNNLTRFYGEMGKVQTNALRNIGHKAATSQLKTLYTNWRTALNSSEFKKGSLDDAKIAFINMLSPMQNYINKYQSANNKIDLSSYKDAIRRMGNDELHQFLLGIDGIFSRTTNVQYSSENSKYKLELGQKSSTLGKVTNKNFERMQSKMMQEANSLVPGAGVALKKLFGIVKNNQSDLNQLTEYGVTSLQNAISYNFGNPDDFSRMIVNPEIVKGSAIKLTAIEEKLGSDYALIKKYFITNLVKNDSEVIAPIISKMKELNSNLSPDDIIKAIEKKSLDIGDKEYKIKYDLGFAYFAQCANHMLTMENFSIEDQEQGETEFATETVDIGTEGKVYQENTGETSSRAEVYNQKIDAGITERLKKEKKGTGTTNPDSDSDGETVPDGEDNNKDVNHDSDIDTTEDNDF